MNDKNREAVIDTPPEKSKDKEVKLGEVLGWNNNTMDQEKIGTVELFLASGLDMEFILQHARFSEVLEANARWGGKKIKGIDEAEILRRLEKGENLEVEMTEGGGKIDLRTLARLLAMKKFNRLMGLDGLPDDELEKKFFRFEDISVKITDTNTMVDYWEECPADNLRNFVVKDYLGKIRENQMGLQWMGNIRDELLEKHHIENAGHAIFKRTHIKKIYGDSYEGLYMPSCYTEAVRDSRTDINKKDDGWRAQGHIHEFSSYNEDYGTSVKFDANLINKHRGGIDYRAFARTQARTYKGALAVQQNEVLEATTEGNLKCVYIGGKDREGIIYKAMHSTYDLGMQKARGYGLTEAEADDRIFTDIIAQSIANNPTDWAMSLSKTFQNQINYDGTKAYQRGAEKWAEQFGFCVKIRCKKLDKYGKPILDAKDVAVVELQTFKNFNELIAYVNQRVALGDLEGVSRTKTINNYEGVSKKDLQATDDELGGLDDDDDDEQENKVDELIIEPCGRILKRMFGDQTEKVLQDYVQHGATASITVDKKTYNIIDFVKEKVEKTTGEEDNKDLTLFGTVSLKMKDPKEALVEFLKALGQIAPDADPKKGKKGAAREKQKIEKYEKFRKKVLESALKS